MSNTKNIIHIFSNKTLVILSLILLLSLAVNVLLLAKINNQSGEVTRQVAKIMIQPVSAAEIYPEFACGCCGKILDPQNICCGDMRQKIEYIDTLIGGNSTKEDIITMAAKKFGLNSLVKAETRAKIKNELIASAPATAPKIVFSQEKKDLGVISQSQGIKTVFFSFKNLILKTFSLKTYERKCFDITFKEDV